MYHKLLCAITLGCALLLGAACRTGPAPAAADGVTPAASRTPGAAATPSPTPRPSRTPTPTATATLTAVERAAADLLAAAPGPCPENTPYAQCVAPLGTAILDFVQRHPETSFRFALAERLIVLAGDTLYPDLEWLIAGAVDTAVRVPIEAQGRPTSALLAQWSAHGRIVLTDLDDDGMDDYLVTVRFGRGTGNPYSSEGGLYWLRRENGRFRLSMLPTIRPYGNVPVEPALKAIRDLNGDGHTDVAYFSTECGASTCFDYLQIMSWQDGGWRDWLATNPWIPENGGWSFTYPDQGPAELIALDGGPGIAGFGLILPYQLRFGVMHGEFVPVEVEPYPDPNTLSPYDKGVASLQWAIKLSYSHRFTETLEVLNPIVTAGKSPDGADYAPYALFRIGMAHLFLRDTAAAKQAWDQLIAAYPDHPVAVDVAGLRPLLGGPEDVWPMCAWLRANRTKGWTGLPDGWAPPEAEPWLLDNAHLIAFQWSDQCDPLLLVPWATWTRTTPLAEQAQARGQGWQLLSDDYDLNGDGLSDPLARLEFTGQPTLWAFLSDVAGYTPLNVMQPLPLGATGLEEGYGWPMPHPGDHLTVQVVDLDHNGWPEIWIDGPNWSVRWEWIGWRFRQQGERVSR
jgi:hypothetical protein